MSQEVLNTVPSPAAPIISNSGQRCQPAFLSRRRAAFLLISTIFAAFQLFADQFATLSGRVVDKSTREPIPGAIVLITDTRLGTSADAEGRFQFMSLSPGIHTIAVTIPGYASLKKNVQLPENAIQEVVLELEENPYQLNPITVTATRSRSLAMNVPANVDVVSLSELERRNVQDLSQAIETLPGLFAKNYGGMGDLKTVSIRGSSSGQVLVLLDGQRLNNVQSGEVDLGVVPLEGIERVEVVRGGGSALYGADAIGGVVNILSKSKPFQNSLGSNVDLFTGSFGTRGLRVGGNYTDDRFFSILSYKYLASNGNFVYKNSQGQEMERGNAGLLSHGVFAKGTWVLADDGIRRSISLAGQFGWSRAGAPGSTEQPRTQAQQENRQRTVNLSYEQNSAAAISHVRAQAYVHSLDYRYDDPEGLVPLHSDDRNTSLGSEIQGTLSIGPFNTAIVGYAFRGDRLTSVSALGTQSRTQHSIYVQDEFSVVPSETAAPWRIAAVPALRWDRFSDFGGRVSPKVGLILSTGDSWQASLKGNVGTSFRAPTFNDLYWPRDAFSEGNVHLVPERSTDLDIGIMFRDQWMGWTSVDVTYFRNSIKDLILWQMAESGLWSPANIGKAETRGVEVKFRSSPLERLLRFEWNYTYLEARNKTENANEFDMLLPYRPKQMHHVSVKTDVLGAAIELSGSYVDKRYTTTANTGALPSYVVTNLLIGFTQTMSSVLVHLGFELKNIADVRYQIMEGYPMPGREIRVSIGARYLNDGAEE